MNPPAWLNGADTNALEQGFQSTQTAQPAAQPSGDGGGWLGRIFDLSNPQGIIRNLAISAAQPVVQYGTALRYTPEAILRELQNKPIDDIQQKAFGTTDQGQIAQKIIGSTLGTEALVAAPLAGRVATPAANIAANAALGGVMGGASSLENNQSAGDIAKNTLFGAATGGALAGAGSLLSRVFGRGAQAASAAAPQAAEHALSPEQQALLDNARATAGVPEPTVTPTTPGRAITQVSPEAPAIETGNKTTIIGAQPKPNGGSVFTALGATPEEQAQAAANMDALRASNEAVINRARAASAEADRVNALVTGKAAPTTAADAVVRPNLPPDVQAFTDAWNKGDYQGAQAALANLKDPNLQTSMQRMLVNRVMDIPGSAAASGANDVNHVANFLHAYNSGDMAGAQAAIEQASPDVRATLQNLVDRQTGGTAGLQAKTDALAQQFTQSQADKAATADLAKNLPKGYTADASGNIISPSGKTLSIADLQTIDTKRPAYLAQFEAARNQGDLRTMQRIAAQHPGDPQVASDAMFPNGSVAGATPERPSNLLQRVGRGFERAGVPIKLPGSSPYYARSQAELQTFMRDNGLLHAGSNPQSILNDLPAKMDAYQQQLRDMLQTTDATVPAADLKAQIEAAVNKGSTFKGTDATMQKIIDNTQAAIDKMAGTDGNLTAGQLYDLKSQMQSELDAAYNRLEKGASISPADQALMTARNTVNDQLPYAIRKVGQNESVLHDIAGAMKTAAQKTATVPRIAGLVLPHMRSTALAHAIESTGTAVGVPLEALGNLQEAITRGGLLGRVAQGVAAGARSAANIATMQPEEIAPAIAAAAGRAGNAIDTALAANAGTAPIRMAANEAGIVAAGVPGVTPAQPASPSQPAAAQPQAAQAPGTPVPNSALAVANLPAAPQDQPSAFGFSLNDVNNAIAYDVLANGGRNMTQLKELQSLLQQEQTKNTLNASEAAQLDTMNQASAAIDNIDNAYKKAGGAGKGVISWLEGTPVGNVLPGGVDVHNLNNALAVNAAPIAKALGLGNTAEAIKGFIASYLPGEGDTQAVATAKLNQLRSMLKDAQTQYLATRASNQDALAQMSPLVTGATQ